MQSESGEQVVELGNSLPGGFCLVDCCAICAHFGSRGAVCRLNEDYPDVLSSAEYLRRAWR